MKFISFLMWVSSWTAMAGGISGGGGGTVPIDLIPPQELKEVVLKNRWQIELFFNRLEMNLRKSNKGACADALCSKLFDQTTTVFDVLRTATVEFAETGPCQAPDGTF